MFGWLFGRKLEDVLFKTVRVHGVKFVIRKLSPMDYLSGSKAIRQVFETAKPSPSIDNVEMSGRQYEQASTHYADVFIAAVLEPKLKRAKDDGDAMPVEYLMTDWDLANALYEQILLHTYGKKKLLQLASQKSAALNSTQLQSGTESYQATS